VKYRINTMIDRLSMMLTRIEIFVVLSFFFSFVTTTVIFKML